MDHHANGCSFIQHIFIVLIAQWFDKNNCFLVIVAMTCVLFGKVVRLVSTSHKAIISFRKGMLGLALVSVFAPFFSHVWGLLTPPILVHSSSSNKIP